MRDGVYNTGEQSLSGGDNPRGFTREQKENRYDEKEDRRVGADRLRMTIRAFLRTFHAKIPFFRPRCAMLDLKLGG